MSIPCERETKEGVNFAGQREPKGKGIIDRLNSIFNLHKREHQLAEGLFQRCRADHTYWWEWENEREIARTADKEGLNMDIIMADLYYLDGSGL